MARTVPTTKLRSSMILDLERNPLFLELSPEKLGSFARNCKEEIILQDQSREVLHFPERILFIADGTFESIYFDNVNLVENSQMAIVLDELKTGDTWGEELIFSLHDTQKMKKIGLRSLSKGRLLSMQLAKFEKFLSHWTELQVAFLKFLIQKEHSYASRLGHTLAKIQNTDIVLDRIESVAELLINNMIESAEGDSKGKNVIQRRFLLSRKPDINDKYTSYSLQQVYIDIVGDKEDRIRRVISEDGIASYNRTTKFGSGLQRKVFDRKIQQTEYFELLNKKKGNAINKTRIILKNTLSSASKLVVDIFEENLKDFVIVEAEFDSLSDSDRFQLPDFLKKNSKEITEDSRYSNQSLALYGRP